MRNPLQEQLLKAGLVKKAKVAEVAREQARQRHGKQPAAPTAAQRDAEQALAARAERDRTIAAGHNAVLRANELRAQVRQLVLTHRVRRDGDIAYRFTADGRIAMLLVDAAQRAQLASGALVIVRSGDQFELVDRAAAERIRARDADVIVLDHGAASTSATPADAIDPHYAKFEVPDDLVW